MRKLAFAAAALVLAAGVGCGDREGGEEGTGGATDSVISRAAAPAEAAVRQSSEAAADVRDFAFEQRQDFVASIRQQLAGMDQEIEQLAGQAKSTGGAVSNRALTNIRAARQAVNRNLQRVDNASAANWQEIRSAVTDAVDSLAEAVEQAQPK